MHPLMLHQSCELGPIKAVTVNVKADGTLWMACGDDGVYWCRPHC